MTLEGEAGGEPASLALEIAPPLWHRGWFVVIAALSLAMALETVHRAQLRHRLELEAIRTRIATDLHDDIGSNLSRIAILTEVARRDVDGRNPATRERLDLIASVSRDLIDSMSDIVWAVAPARDRPDDLTRRMRRFADDVLSVRNIDLTLHMPADDEVVALPLDTRREAFLVFKEAVNNLARHSGCRSAEIALRSEDGWLELTVSDDGRGFDLHGVSESGDGNGLSSMKRRAERLGGTLEITSRLGDGTTLGLRVPSRRHGWLRRLLRRSASARRSGRAEH